jgi:hypothetical protein
VASDTIRKSLRTSRDSASNALQAAISWLRRLLDAGDAVWLSVETPRYDG